MGSETRVKETSRVVKQIYDRIQDEYNGQYDEQHDHWVNARRSFFTSEDIIELAKEFGAFPTSLQSGYRQPGRERVVVNALPDGDRCTAPGD